jgi:universal stress protein A
MTTQHVLVPVDFSADAEQALDYAMRLARTLHARLTLLHVIEPLAVGSMDALPYAFVQDLEDKITQAMVPYRERVQAAGLRCDFAIMHGVPFHVIVDIARKEKTDLIIMGTHGRTGLRHVLLGSVAERVVRLAPCPVLVVRLRPPATAQEAQ